MQLSAYSARNKSGTRPKAFCAGQESYTKLQVDIEWGPLLSRSFTHVHVHTHILCEWICLISLKLESEIGFALSGISAQLNRSNCNWSDCWDKKSVLSSFCGVNYTLFYYVCSITNLHCKKVTVTCLSSVCVGLTLSQLRHWDSYETYLQGHRIGCYIFLGASDILTCYNNFGFSYSNYCHCYIGRIMQNFSKIGN